MIVSKGYIRRLARCGYLASREKVQSTSSEVMKAELFSSLFHTGSVASASPLAIDYQVKARKDTLDRLSNAVEYLSGRTEKKKAPFTAAGNAIVSGMSMGYSIKSYGRYLTPEDEWTEDAILQVSFRESMISVWDDPDSWQYNSYKAGMMYDSLMASMWDEDVFASYCNAIKEEAGRRPGMDISYYMHELERYETGLKETVYPVLHLAVDSGPVYPPLIKPIWLRPTPLVLGLFFISVWNGYHNSEQYKKLDGYNPAAAIQIDAGRQKCRGKIVCPSLSSCPYGRYGVEQMIEI